MKAPLASATLALECSCSRILMVTTFWSNKASWNPEVQTKCPSFGWLHTIRVQAQRLEGTCHSFRQGPQQSPFFLLPVRLSPYLKLKFSSQAGTTSHNYAWNGRRDHWQSWTSSFSALLNLIWKFQLLADLCVSPSFHCSSVWYPPSIRCKWQQS